MVDRNNNGIDDRYENLKGLADSLGVDAPQPERAAGGETSVSEEEVSRIFAGDIRVPLYDSGIGRESVGRIPIEQTREQALAEFGAFSDKDRRRLAKLAEAAGVDTKFSSLQWFWQQGVNNAEAAYATGQRVSPWDYLESWAQEPAARTSGRGGRAGAYTGPRTSVSITSEADAEVLLQDAARQMIGRSLSDEELEKYTRRFRNREREAVTTTTSTPGSTVTEQGTSKETILSDLMQSNPDFGRYQIDTGFMDLFVNSIREGQAVINAGR